MKHNRSIKLLIESEIENIPVLSKAVRAICNTVVSDEILLYNLELCLVEAISNVINHAYARRPGNIVEVLVEVNDQYVIFQILDSGVKPSLDKFKSPLDHQLDNVASLPESGRGLFLINQIMSEVSFTEQGNKNVLTMKKIF